MFTAFGCTDTTFILNFYHQCMYPVVSINVKKSERKFRKQKPKTGTIIHLILIAQILKLNKRLI